jgi:hypothetical protein
MIANIASDDGLILPHSATPTGSNFRERQVDLMPQYQDFSFKPSLRFEAVAQSADENECSCDHSAITF